MHFRTLSGVALAALLFAVAALPLSAQDRPWTASIEAAHTGGCFTDDVGAILSYKATLTVMPNSETLRYGFVDETLRLPCSPDLQLRAYLARQINEHTSVSLRLSPIGKCSNRLDRTIQSEKDVLRWPQMYGANVFPVRNDLDPSGRSPVNLFVEDCYSAFVADAAVSHAVFARDGWTLAISGGVRAIHSKYQRKDGQDQHAAVLIGIGDEGGLYFDNRITLVTLSEVDNRGLGPTVGAELRKQLGAFSVGARVDKSLVYTASSWESRFDDVDDILYHLGDYGEHTPFYTILLDGQAVRTDASSDWKDITDLRIDARLDRGRFHITAGADLSHWRNMPLAAEFIGPWNLGSPVKAPTGFTWENQYKDVTFTSLFAGIGVSF